MPLLFLGLLEISLRLAGFGYSTNFFQKVSLNGGEWLVNNDNFALRFFPPELVRLPRPFMIETRKPSEVYRIYIFGESAAEGDPDPAYGPGRFLEVLLRERFPKQRFEIINTGVTANDSHGILPIAREGGGHQGNFWIIYMGNNEMIGPFGAATVFGGRAPPLLLVRGSLALQETRVGQLLKDCVRTIKDRKNATASWGGLEMFESHHINPKDTGKLTVYDNFSRNLDDILKAGMNSGARILLNTVAVNLKDCPPLASEHSAGLSPGEISKCDALSAQSKSAGDKGNANAAAKYLEQAAAIDPQCADVQYRWGRCLLEMTNYSAALDHLQRACDCDALPARTDSRINSIIREAAKKYAGTNLVFFDAPAALGKGNPDGICGSETFYEHVHFRPNGSYRLGLAWAEQVEAALPESTRGKTAAPWISQELCERRLAMTDWNRRNDLGEIVNRRHAAPLNSQSNNAQELQKLQQELADLNSRMNAEGAARANEICRDAISRAPQDMDLHCNYADFLEATGHFSDAADQWRDVQKILPRYYMGYFQEGRMLERLGRLDLARAAFLETVALRPVMAPAWFELSNIDASQGNLKTALGEVSRSQELEPHRPVYYACMGKLYSRMNRHTEAVEHFRKALKVDASYWDGYIALGQEFASINEWPDAQAEFETAVQLRPESTIARLDLGASLARQGNLDAAKQQFEAVLKLAPGNQQAQDSLQKILASRVGAH